MPHAVISGRSVFSVTGPQAEHFLQNVITTDLDHLPADCLKPGALLTPQGKIIADFLIARPDEDDFLIDVADPLTDDLVRRLTMYKMRAQVEISKPEQKLVGIRWSDDSDISYSDSTLRDGRFAEPMQVKRIYQGLGTATSLEPEWMVLRIACGVAECGTDYQPESAFPHDVLMDFNGGVSFKKGCFVGQEVVSRMQHRGTARRRVMIADGESPLPEPGSEITAEGKPVGSLGSVAGSTGLALIRVDRASDAVVEGQPILAGTTEIALRFPEAVPLVFPLTETAEGTD